MKKPVFDPQPTDEDFLETLIEMQKLYDAHRALYRRIAEDRSWADSEGRSTLLRRIAESGTALKEGIDHKVNDWFSRW